MWEQTKSIFLDSLQRVVNATARLLPRLLAVAAVIAVSVALALVVRLLVRRVCRRLEVDRRAREWGFAAPGGPGARPALLLERLAGWSIVAGGFLVGLSVVDAGATSALAIRLVDYLPHALLAVVTLGAGMAAARALSRSVLIGAVNMGLHSARMLGLGVRWLVLVLATAMALEQLGVGGGIVTLGFGILFGGIVLTLALAVGLGARDMVARSLERRFGVEDRGEEEEHEDVRHL
jgi:hypothetical protein